MALPLSAQISSPHHHPVDWHDWNPSAPADSKELSQPWTTLCNYFKLGIFYIYDTKTWKKLTKKSSEMEAK